MPSPGSLIDRAMTVVLVGCAVVLTAVIVRRADAPEREGSINKPQTVKDRQRLGEVGNRME